ncbi:Uncharacterized protein FWK35_00004652, partial [Aphis craccivora]
KNCPIGAEDLLQYFDQNYIGGTYFRKFRKTNNLILRRILYRFILFVPELWNVNLTTLSTNLYRIKNASQSLKIGFPISLSIIII